MARALVVILDSFGLGSTPDARRFGDDGANTLGHIAAWCVDAGRPLHLPNLARLGLPQAARAACGEWPIGLNRLERPQAAFGSARQISRGKDTPSGHWELMGCPVSFDWGYFPVPADPMASAFPTDLMTRWYHECGIGGSLCNRHMSGTEVLIRFGCEHEMSGWPICYTSSDSVFQVAAHEEFFGLERLYQICELAKPIFDSIGIARVIARPFTGADGQYRRTGGRHDYTTPPPGPTLLDVLASAGREVHAVGKISDIFAGRGISHEYHADGNSALCRRTLEAWEACPDGGLVFSNLVDFDMLYGHRRDVAGYANALQIFDNFLPQLIDGLRHDDVMVLSADHGCDPTWPGTDHTREFVPLLFFGHQVPAPFDFGVRNGFADLGQTLARHLQVGPLAHGQHCW